VLEAAASPRGHGWLPAPASGLLLLPLLLLSAGLRRKRA